MHSIHIYLTCCSVDRRRAQRMGWSCWYLKISSPKAPFDCFSPHHRKRGPAFLFQDYWVGSPALGLVQSHLASGTFSAVVCWAHLGTHAHTCTLHPCSLETSTKLLPYHKTNLIFCFSSRTSVSKIQEQSSGQVGDLLSIQ